MQSYQARAAESWFVFNLNAKLKEVSRIPKCLIQGGATGETEA